MRILALLTDGFGGHGGIAQYNCDLMTAVARSPKVDSVVAIPRFGEPTTSLPFGISQHLAEPNRLFWAGSAAQQVLTTRPDVIFCGHLNAAPLAAGIAKVVSRPLWVQLHGIEAWAGRGGLIRRAAESATLVTAVSRYTRNRFLTWADIAPERVRVLPNTYAGDYRVQTPRDDLIEKYGLKGRKVILTVGRIAKEESYKGHDRIIKCLPRLRNEVSQVIYLVVGAGDGEPRLKQLSRELGVDNCVIFAGAVSKEDLPAHYALADVFAMPSTGEGFGIVFLEAAASGLTVIGGNCDGSVDALADGTIGVLLDPNDLNAIVSALSVALQRERKSASELVQRFSFENFALQVDQLLGLVRVTAVAHDRSHIQSVR